MDKITSGDWMKSFSMVKHTTIQSGQRYFEMASTVHEPGLASVNALIIKMQGMTAQLVSINPERELLLCTSQENECIQSAFILNGFADSKFGNRPVVTKGNTNAFQYSPSVEERHKIMSQNLDALHIEFDIDFFRNLVLSSNSRELDMLCNCMEKKETFLTPPTLLPLQARMNEIIHAIKNCNFNSLTRSLFMEAKLMELFALQLEQIGRLNEHRKETCSKADKEKLFAVKDFIEQNYLQLLSLKQLSLMFGLNEFKLKKGYKGLFHTTVFGHIHHLRMQKAMQLLAQKRLTVTEVANMMGYSSIGNFSAEFKKKFGCPPTRAHG